jgi:hypothetical protein
LEHQYYVGSSVGVCGGIGAGVAVGINSAVGVGTDMGASALSWASVQMVHVSQFSIISLQWEKRMLLSGQRISKLL